MSCSLLIVRTYNNGQPGGNMLDRLLGPEGPQGPIYVDNNNQGNRIPGGGCTSTDRSGCPRCSERLRQARVSTITLRVPDNASHSDTVYVVNIAHSLLLRTPFSSTTTDFYQQFYEMHSSLLGPISFIFMQFLEKK